MTAYLHDLWPALSAETLKTKRTLALALAFIAPVLVVVLNFLIYWQRAATFVAEDRAVWTSLLQNNLIFWNLLMVPLFISLQTALLAGLEHAHKNWKHLFALPISRSAIYTAKQVVALGLLGLSSLVLCAGIIASGLLLRSVAPELGLSAAVPVWAIFKFVMLSFIASWLIIGIHTWIGMHWSSFVAAMSVGVAVTVVGVIAVQSDYPHYFPWTMPAAVIAEALRTGTIVYGWILAGALGGVLAAILGGFEFVRRDVL